ncbi:MAG: hypothetical protein BGO63_09865 [Candidatus Accumulibacter sp. 66-26]|nr:DUF2917 domain-containing protein [Accumulibacter sp.]OJW49553.1 MAG: hypothetical protein BGO63_09865 [Candidatus Accumulibacter sp. 66-26]
MRPTVQAAQPGWLHLELARRDVLVLADADDRTLACHAGELWLTEDGRSEDFILKAGDTHAIRGAGSVVVTACRAARFALGDDAPRGAPLRRASGRLAALLAWEAPGPRFGLLPGCAPSP